MASVTLSRRSIIYARYQKALAPSGSPDTHPIGKHSTLSSPWAPGINPPSSNYVSLARIVSLSIHVFSPEMPALECTWSTTPTQRSYDTAFFYFHCLLVPRFLATSFAVHQFLFASSPLSLSTCANVDPVTMQSVNVIIEVAYISESSISIYAAPLTHFFEVLQFPEGSSTQTLCHCRSSF